MSGVPQGSVLGPFLFVIYLNDLPDLVHCKTVMYADDTTFITSHTDKELAVQMNDALMKEASQWFKDNRLKINDNKTIKILFSLRNVDVDLHNLIEKSVKLPGIHLDSKLCWNTQSEKVCNKLSMVVHLLKKLKSCISKDILILTYYFSPTHIWVMGWYSEEILLVFKMYSSDRRRQLDAFLIYKILLSTNITQNTNCYHLIHTPSISLCQRECPYTYETRSDVHNLETRNRNLINVPWTRLS